MPDPIARVEVLAFDRLAERFRLALVAEAEDLVLALAVMNVEAMAAHAGERIAPG